MSKIDTLTIIVSFNSDIKKLGMICERVSNYSDIIIIDNSTSTKIKNEILDLSKNDKIHLVSLEENVGIATAQNIGIKFAILKNYDDIFLLDDDSIPEENAISKLKKARNESDLTQHIVGARLIDRNGNNLSHCKYSTNSFTPCKYLTSSGTLIPTKVFVKFGLFEEKLFIDCVDFEFGWRVKMHSVKQYVSNNINIEHELGESNSFILKLPTPIRHYYQYRNIMTLVIRRYTPLKWKIMQFIKLPIKFVLIFMFADKKIIRAKYCIQGYKDFFVGRYGAY